MVRLMRILYLNDGGVRTPLKLLFSYGFPPIKKAAHTRRPHKSKLSELCARLRDDRAGRRNIRCLEAVLICSYADHIRARLKFGGPVIHVVVDGAVLIFLYDDPGIIQGVFKIGRAAAFVLAEVVVCVIKLGTGAVELDRESESLGVGAVSVVGDHGAVVVPPAEIGDGSE